MERDGKDVYFETVKIRVLKGNGVSEQEISPKTCCVIKYDAPYAHFLPKVSLETDMTFIMTPIWVLCVWQQD
jgi:hypothetical protein